MKDLPHHMKKLNRRVIRSMQREEQEGLPEVPTWPVTKREEKKKAKQKMKAEREARVPAGKDPEERNRIMKGGRRGRVPVFDQNKGTVKVTKPTSKKTPRI